MAITRIYQTSKAQPHLSTDQIMNKMGLSERG